MKNPFEAPGETPVTFLCAIAYVTLTLLCNVDSDSARHLIVELELLPLHQSTGRPWQLLTHAFLHIHPVHLLFNLYFLVMFAPVLERSLGSLRFLVLYLVAAIGGGIAVCLLYPPEQPVVGGSGALFGMMGAVLAMQMRSGRHLLSFLDWSGPRQLIGLIVVNLVISWMMPMVSNTAHIGGLLAGFGVTFYFLQWPRRQLQAIGWALRAGLVTLFASTVLWSMFPVTRWDHLWNAGAAADDAETAIRLHRLAAARYFGIDEATEADVQRMHQDLFEPPAEDGAHRGR